MANTKVTSRVLADDAVGLAQLNITNDPSDGQALTAANDGTNNYNLTWADAGASSINDLSDAKTFGTSSIMLGDTTTGTIDAANYNVGLGIDVLIENILGGGSYIVGEETARLESIEGKQAMPRNKPPFPAIKGLYGCPTTINYTATLASIPMISARGSDWFK